MHRPLALLATVVAQLSAQSASPRTIELPAPNGAVTAEFTNATSIRELSDRRVLIVDASDKKLLVGNWTNGSVTQISRNGSGPGEYAQPFTLLALGGDSTLLPDSRNGRWLLLHGASIVSTIGPDAPAIRSGARLPLGADNRGRVIFPRSIGPASRASTAQPRLDSVLLVRVALATTGRADTLDLLRSRRSTIKVEGPAEKPTSVSVFVNPLAVAELAILFPDGWISRLARVRAALPL